MPSKVVGKSSVYVDLITGLVHVDGVPICKKIIRDGKTYLQFKDRSNMSSRCRGSCFVEILLADFEKSVQGVRLI